MPDYGSVDINFGGQNRKFHFRRQSSDEAVVKSVLIDRQYDLGSIGRAEEMLELVRRRQASGLRPLIVDAGANIGAASVYFCANFPGSKVVAIEPEPENFDLLRRNVEGLDVQPMQAALAANSGHVRVVDPGRGNWAFRTEAAQAESAGTVPSVTIEDIYRKHANGFFPLLVKVDIEGAERELFSEATGWIARTPMLVVELHDWMLPRRGISAPFLKCIVQLDRDFITRGENCYSIANDFDKVI